MDTINFQQSGGFPLETNTLDAMQGAYSIFNNLGELAGNKTILKGCGLLGNLVGNGFIYLNGEVLEFRGGQQQTSIIIKQDITEAIFESGDTKEIYYKRYATFGTGAGAINWSDFKRIDPMLVLMQRLTELEKKTAIFQADGGMVFWNKPANEIPAGWQEVVDWRGRFPVGLDISQVEFDTLGKVGGEKEVVLTKNNLPNINLNGTTNISGNHTHNTNSNQGMVKQTGSNTMPHAADNSPNELDVYNAYPLPNDGSHSHNVTIPNIGNDEAHNNLPPYRVVLFIEYIG